MELRYGQPLQLRKDIDLSFYCDGILPTGQMGYQETHYKIKFDQATLTLPQTLVNELFEEYKINDTDEQEGVSKVSDYTKLKKDELIKLVGIPFPNRDYTKLKKDDLIQILQGTDAQR